MAVLSPTTLAVALPFEGSVAIWDLSTGRLRRTLRFPSREDASIYLIAKQSDGSVAFAVENEIWTGRLEDWERTRRRRIIGSEDLQAYLMAGDDACITSHFQDVPQEYKVQARGKTIGTFGTPDSFQSMSHTTDIRIQSDRIVAWATDEVKGCFMMILETPAEPRHEALEAAAAGGAPAGGGRANGARGGGDAAASEHLEGGRPQGI